MCRNSLIFRHLVCPHSMPNPVGTGVDADVQKDRDSHEGVEVMLTFRLGVGSALA